MAYNPTYGFGSGVLFGTPSSPANATPIRFGVLQEVTVDFAFSTKQLFGQYQFPVAIGRGTAKITGKAKFARIDVQALTQLFFNLAPAVNNQVVIVDSEAGVVATATYQVAQHVKTPLTDLGVNYATTGQPLVKVASAPAAGQYSVALSTGTYTFNAGDNAATVLVSYSYTETTGSSTVITNPILGAATPFQIDFYQADANAVGSVQWGLRLFNCISGKLSLATKLEDFTIPEFDFEAYANAANQVGLLNLPST